MTREAIATFLEAPITASLATLGRDGFPHMAGMWFALHEERELHMWAYAKSQKVLNLERDPRCAVMIEAGDSYSSLSGVLIRGEAQLVEDVEAIFQIGAELYERYTLPATGRAVADGPEIEIRRQATKRKGIVLGLEWVASWDHSKLG